MRRNQLLILFLFSILCINARDIDIHEKKNGHGRDEIYVDPPSVTYDDVTGELCVYFGSSGTITLDYFDSSGTPCNYIYSESHYGGATVCYTGLPAGYYTITIRSVYSRTYTGNFTVQ